MHNASVTALAARYPDRFLPFAYADIMAGSPAVDEFERWVRDHGCTGAFLINRPYTQMVRRDAGAAAPAGRPGGLAVA